MASIQEIVARRSSPQASPNPNTGVGITSEAGSGGFRQLGQVRGIPLNTATGFGEAGMIDAESVGMVGSAIDEWVKSTKAQNKENEKFRLKSKLNSIDKRMKNWNLSTGEDRIEKGKELSKTIGSIDSSDESIRKALPSIKESLSFEQTNLGIVYDGNLALAEGLAHNENMKRELLKGDIPLNEVNDRLYDWQDSSRKLMQNGQATTALQRSLALELSTMPITAVKSSVTNTWTNLSTNMNMKDLLTITKILKDGEQKLSSKKGDVLETANMKKFEEIVEFEELVDKFLTHKQKVDIFQGVLTEKLKATKEGLEIEEQLQNKLGGIAIEKASIDIQKIVDKNAEGDNSHSALIKAINEYKNLAVASAYPDFRPKLRIGLNKEGDRHLKEHKDSLLLDANALEDGVNSLIFGDDKSLSQSFSVNQANHPAQLEKWINDNQTKIKDVAADIDGVDASTIEQYLRQSLMTNSGELNQVADYLIESNKDLVEQHNFKRDLVVSETRGKQKRAKLKARLDSEFNACLIGKGSSAEKTACAANIYPATKAEIKEENDRIEKEWQSDPMRKAISEHFGAEYRSLININNINDKNLRDNTSTVSRQYINVEVLKETLEGMSSEAGELYTKTLLKKIDAYTKAKTTTKTTTKTTATTPQTEPKINKGKEDITPTQGGLSLSESAEENNPTVFDAIGGTALVEDISQSIDQTKSQVGNFIKDTFQNSPFLRGVGESILPDATTPTEATAAAPKADTLSSGKGYLQPTVTQADKDRIMMETSDNPTTSMRFRTTPDVKVKPLAPSKQSILKEIKSIDSKGNPSESEFSRRNFLVSQFSQLEKNDKATFPLFHSYKYVGEKAFNELKGDLEKQGINLPDDLLGYMEKLSRDEGYSSKTYVDTEGILTGGLGQTGKYLGTFDNLGNVDLTGAVEALQDKISKIKRNENIGDLFSKLSNSKDNTSVNLRENMVSSFYRGSLSRSKHTMALLGSAFIAEESKDIIGAKQLYKEASKEFLNNEEYRKEYTPSGVKKRMERLSDAIKKYSDSLKGKQ